MQSTQRALYAGSRIPMTGRQAGALGKCKPRKNEWGKWGWDCGDGYTDGVCSHFDSPKYCSMTSALYYQESINPLWPFPSQPWGGVSILGCVCNRGYTRVNGSCVLCAAGTYKETWGTGGCLNCPSLQYSRSSRSGCAHCPAGKASTQIRGAEDTACAECEAGKYKWFVESWSHEENAYQWAGRTACQGCPSGTYQPYNGSTTCFFCPHGKAGNATENSTSEASGCIVYCKPGFVQDGVGLEFGSTLDSVTSNVQWQWYLDDVRQKQRCEPCEAGKFSSTYAYHNTLDFKWLYTGPVPDSDHLARLAQALARKIQLNQSFEFTTQEVQAFGIDLHRSSSKFDYLWEKTQYRLYSQTYIVNIHRHFKLTAPNHSGWETLPPNHSGWETLQDRCNSCPTLTTSDPSGPPIADVSGCTCNG